MQQLLVGVDVGCHKHAAAIGDPGGIMKRNENLLNICSIVFFLGILHKVIHPILLLNKATNKLDKKSGMSRLELSGIDLFYSKNELFIKNS